MNSTNIKIGNAVPDCLCTNVDVKTYPVLSNASNYYTFSLPGVTTTYYHGIYVCPYDFNKNGNYTVYRMYAYPWDLYTPGLGCDTGGYAHYGYSQKDYGYNRPIDDRNKYKYKNITKTFCESIPTSGIYPDTDSYGMAIMYWCPENKFVNGFIDFQDRPLILHIHEDSIPNINNGHWDTSLDGALSENVVDISNDNKTITIHKIKPIYVSGVYEPIVCVWVPDSPTKQEVITAMTDLYVKFENIEFHNGGITRFIDPSSCESYKIYSGDALVWDTPRTIENCWRKYGICSPGIEEFLRINESQDYKRLTASKAVFYSGQTHTFQSDEVTYNQSLTSYVSVRWASRTLKITVLKGSVTINWARTITNGQQSSGEDLPNLSGTFTHSTAGTYTDEIPAISIDELLPTASTMTLRLLTLTITADALSEIIVEIVNNNATTAINKAYHPASYTVKVPTVTDYDGSVKINCSIYNDTMWSNIKDYFANNPTTKEFFGTGCVFYDSDLNGSITIVMPENESFMASSRSFGSTDVEEICFKKTHNRELFTSIHQLFEFAGCLKTIRCVIDLVDENDDTDAPYICAPRDASGAFNQCYSLTTYPSNFINWYWGRSGEYTVGENCTAISQMCLYSGFVTIPAYLSQNENENTIVISPYAIGAFAYCPNLTTIGPILDFGLLVPNLNDSSYNASQMFAGSPNIADVKIANLNHGTWYFDRNGVGEYTEKDILGRLSNLTKQSVEYLFNHVCNLNEHVPGYDYQRSASRSFLSWLSYYRTQYLETYYWKYKFLNDRQIQCRYAFADDVMDDLHDEHWIAYVNGSVTNFTITIKVQGLSSSLNLYWIDGTSKTAVTLDADNKVSITHTLGLKSGFVLTNTSLSDINTDVVISLRGGLNMRIPRVSSAKIYCPIEWEDLDISKSACENAINKGWSLKVVENGIERDFDYEFNPPEYVDLGLPSGTLWAKYDVGNTANDNNSPLFSWGNTEGYNSYGSYSFSKSNYDATPGANIGNNEVIPKENDAAHALYGGKWRIATFAQYKELIANTDHSNGRFYKKNDSSVFIGLRNSVIKYDTNRTDYSNPSYFIGNSFNDEFAYGYLEINGVPKLFLDTCKRHFGLALRATKQVGTN